MNNPISDLTDAAFEQVEDIKRAVERDIVKGIPAAVKQQIAGGKQKDEMTDKSVGTMDRKEDKGNKNSVKSSTDPVTGKPVASKKAVSDLQRSLAQLSSLKLKKIREDLERQRLKVSEEKNKLSPTELAKLQKIGPQITEGSPEKGKDNAVAATLKGSKSTGEFKGLVGG